MRSSPATEVPGVNVAALTRYLPAVLDDYDPQSELTARLLAGGRSNLTCLLSQPGGAPGPLPLDHLQACLGLACLKLAVVMESIHFRHRSGQALDPLSAGLGEAAPALLELGLAVAGGQGLAGLAA